MAGLPARPVLKEQHRSVQRDFIVTSFHFVDEMPWELTLGDGSEPAVKLFLLRVSLKVTVPFRNMK